MNEETVRLESEIVQEISSQFEDGNIFFNSLDLPKEIERSINFYEGRQWYMGEELKDFRKIVLNIIKQIANVRLSGILQNDYGYLVNTNAINDVRKIQDWLKHLGQKLKLQKKDIKMIKDTFTKGTGIKYYYWDAESRDLMKRSGGNLKSEVLDIRRVRVANPYIQDIQEQEWVIFYSRERVESIKKKYNVEVEADEEINTNKTEKYVSNTDVNKNFVSVYTKFYRNQEGQVFSIITTKTKLLRGAKPLNPFYKGTSQYAPNTMTTPDQKEEKTEKYEGLSKEAFNLYPFATLVLDERDNCFYGIPGAVEYFEAQKSVNNNFSVFDKALQDNVLGGFVMKRGILGDQELTTENGQMIQLDMLPQERINDVFGRIPVNNVPADAINYSTNLMSMTRQVAGATNVQIGQSDYAGQSGKQTQALLQRAKENSSGNMMLFNEHKKEEAQVLFLFSKFYYDNEEFNTIEHGATEDIARDYTGDKKFNGNKYVQDDVMIDIKVGPSPSFSEYSSLEILGLSLQSGQIPFEVYLASLPDGYINNRQELLNLAKNNSMVVIKQLQQQLQESQKVMQMMTEEYKKVQKDRQNIDTVIRENQTLKSMLAELSSSAIKIQNEATKQNKELTNDMVTLLNAMKGLGGIGGQKN